MLRPRRSLSRRRNLVLATLCGGPSRSAPALVALLAVLFSPAASAASQPLAQTEQGWLQGITVGDVDQFRGVPYAAPPLGALRWQPPQPPQPYPGVRDASAFGASCVGRSTAPPASEDCLYLNVYRPAHAGEGKDMPVLVYIHGGGFAGGSGAGYDGTPIASANDMVVVMINYRLGPLGWLASSALDAEAGGASGNYGFLDMLQALRWLKRNVRAFGGNPENVTIAGTSAGGISVCALVTAPIGDEHLFRGGIMESAECTHGSAFIVTHATAVARGDAFAAKLGCTDPATAAACLRAAPASAIVGATAGLPSLAAANVGGALLAKHPIDAIPETEHMVPVLVGAVHDETKAAPVATTGFPGTEAGYLKYLTNAFGAAAPLVAAQYPVGDFGDPAYAAGAAASDSGYPSGIGVCPMLLELGDALSRVTKTYAWEMNDPNGGSLGAVPAGFQVGSEHASNTRFLYDAAIQAPPRTPEQDAMGARMIRYWGTFAHNAIPGGAELDWPRFDKTRQVIRFQPSGDALVPETTASAEHRCSFWSVMGF